MKNVEQEGHTFKRVISAVLAGALVGYMLFESEIVDLVKDDYYQQRVEMCGPKLDHCPTPETIIVPHW